MIGKTIAIVLLGFSSLTCIYKAGKYANGGKDVIEGKAAAAAYIINGLVTTAVTIALYLDL